MVNSKRTPDSEPIAGHVDFPGAWTVFAPWEGIAPAPPKEALKSIPKEIALGGKTVQAQQVRPIGNQYDFSAFFGKPPYDAGQTAYVFVALHSESAQEVTLGFGADYYMQAWLNGETVLDTMEHGNQTGPPTIDDFHIAVTLQPGRNVLAVRLVNGIAAAVLALGGPDELRRGDFKSIFPEPRKMDLAALAEKYPPDPEAPVRWIAPDGFDPEVPGLGLPPMQEAEHFELLHCLPSKAPLDEGGTGRYESLKYGTWNHNIGIAVFRDRLIGIWDNHALDENGPGGRVVARVGKILNERGDVDWGGDESLVEPAPQPVPVRRRKLHSDHDAVRGAQAKGEFFAIDDRLFFCGRLSAIHGMTSDPSRSLREGPAGKGRPIPPEHFHFGPGPEAIRGGFIHWDLGFDFYQEWGVRDDRLQPVSPIYKENDMPDEMALTPELSLPLEPLIPPYSTAPLLSEAPDDFRALVRDGERKGFRRSPRYRPGTRRLAHDGLNGLAHGTEFRRPDGVWVAIRENQSPRVQPFYYAAVKPDAESFYPPARRTNLYGAVNPAAGELPDGQVFLLGNSPNRRNMYVTVSRDGRVFDRTWLLMYKQLSDYTPGAMKKQGGPGAGPQYFAPAVVGESLWMVYSISKEHVGATRVPISSLCR